MCAPEHTFRDPHLPAVFEGVRVGNVPGHQEELGVTAKASGFSSDVIKQHGGPAGMMTSSFRYETPRAPALERSQPLIPLRLGPDFFLRNL